MTEEPLSRDISSSGDSNLSGGGEIHPSIITSLDERLLNINITAQQSLNVLRTPPTKKAKRVRFFRNGDKFYTGVVMAVTPERYRSFDSLASDLTRALVSSVTLPNGVRAIYSMDGRKISSIGDLEDGKCYVVSGQGEIFKKVEYSASKVRRGSSLSGLPQSPAGSGRQISAIPPCVKAKIITLIRNGTKPRKVVRLLLNKRNAPSLEHVLEAITEAVKLDSGAVRKVYSLSGQQISSLDQFFENEEIFVAYGTEKSSQDDFELDFEESKCVQSFRRGPWLSKRQSGPMPKMPRKSGKKSLTAPHVRTPSPSSLMLPQPLRLHYSVGHVIGDGNFAIVRHCVHKTTGAEYAIKIVDKYKCQGKETMLASEVAILRQVCHPNIISLIAEQETTDQLFLVMELVKGGDLFDAIAAATKFSEPEASVMVGHLTSALAYLHSHHIVHRDVKPENLLVEMDGSRVRCLKLGDFGLAQVVKEPLYTVCGTPTYVAPEILAETGYGLKIDVWAAGVILYILLCGFPPFVSPENEQEELFERILSGQYEFTSPYWDSISDSAKQLISNMLQSQPELRFSAEDVLDHPWLASFLGGEQTAPTTAVESTQQHGDQQCQPIRLATFEFDYKKKRLYSAQEITKVSPGSQKSQWSDITPITHMNAELEAEITHDDVARGQDETDFAIECDCSVSQTIHTFMHDLVDDSDKSHRSRICSKSSRSATSSISSINEKIDYPEKKLWNSESNPKVRFLNKRNGASLSNVHSSTTVEKTKSKRTSLYGTLEHLSNGNTFVKDTRDSNVYSSADCLSGSSSNDIETSDSFVNIQFARMAQRRKSSSTHSLESSDSFENIRFTSNYKDKDIVLVQNTSKTITPTNSKTPEFWKNVRQTWSVSAANTAKSSKIPVQQNPKQIDLSKNIQNETVRLRDKKNKTGSNNQSDGPNKRASCIGQYSIKKDSNELEQAKLSRSVVGSSRKFNSTDELREEKQKQSVKVKRFSLYYTPQPLRKIYETESKAGKQTCKSRSGGSDNKMAESNKGKEDLSRNRRSVIENTTAASRSRSNKQSTHIREKVTQANFSAGRTK